jgi:hypothetical protein
MGWRIWAAVGKIRKGKKERGEVGWAGKRERVGSLLFFFFFSFSNPFQIFFKPF